MAPMTSSAGSSGYGHASGASAEMVRPCARTSEVGGGWCTPSASQCDLGGVSSRLSSGATLHTRWRSWCSASSAKHASVGSPACAATLADGAWLGMKRTCGEWRRRGERMHATGGLYGAWLGMKRTWLSEAQKLALEIELEIELEAEGECSSSPLLS